MLLIAIVLGGATALLAATLVGAGLARAGFPLPEPRRRIGEVDGLRGYLALFVMVHHLALWVWMTRLEAPWGGTPATLLNHFGSGAVALFFMATGLVFYPRVLEGGRATAWRRLVVARVFRIVPLTAVSVLAVALIVLGETGGRVTPAFVIDLMKWVTGWHQVDLLGFAHTSRINAGVLWSLWYEWVFYLALLPLCAFAMDAVRARGWPTVALPVGALGVTLVASWATGASVTHLRLVQVMPLFAMGMLAFECRAVPRVADVLARPRVGGYALALLLLAVLSTGDPYGWALPAYALVFACVACGNRLGVLASAGARVLGECSFGVYLLHGMVLWLTFTRVPLAGVPTLWLPALLPILAVTAVLVAAAAHLVIERPMIALGRRVAPWRRSPRLVEAVG